MKKSKLVESDMHQKKNKKPVESQEEEPIESVKDEEPFESSLEVQLDQLKHVGSLEGDTKKIDNEVNKLTEELREKDNEDIIPKEKNDKPKQDKKEFDNLENEVESPENKKTRVGNSRNKDVFDRRMNRKKEYHHFRKLDLEGKEETNGDSHNEDREIMRSMKDEENLENSYERDHLRDAIKDRKFEEIKEIFSKNSSDNTESEIEKENLHNQNRKNDQYKGNNRTHKYHTNEKKDFNDRKLKNDRFERKNRMNQYDSKEQDDINVDRNENVDKFKEKHKMESERMVNVDQFDRNENIDQSDRRENIDHSDETENRDQFDRAEKIDIFDRKEYMDYYGEEPHMDQFDERENIDYYDKNEIIDQMNIRDNWQKRKLDNEDIATKLRGIAYKNSNLRTLSMKMPEKVDFATEISLNEEIPSNDAQNHIETKNLDETMEQNPTKANLATHIPSNEEDDNDASNQIEEENQYEMIEQNPDEIYDAATEDYKELKIGGDENDGFIIFDKDEVIETQLAEEPEEEILESGEDVKIVAPENVANSGGHIVDKAYDKMLNVNNLNLQKFDKDEMIEVQTKEALI